MGKRSRLKRLKRIGFKDEKEVKEKDWLLKLKNCLEKGEIDFMLWLMHFPNNLDKRVSTCQDCADYNFCENKDKINPIDCFIKKTNEGNYEIVDFIE